MSSIDIFDSKNPNLPLLSNNSEKIPLIIQKHSKTAAAQEEIYKSVTEYIYTNLLNTKHNKSILKRAKTSEIRGLYQSLQFQEDIDVIREALRVAYTFLLEQSKDFTILLLQTQGTEIVFESPIQILGTSESNQYGKNEVGKVLSSIRQKYNNKLLKDQSQIQEQKDIDEIRNDIRYQIFIAKSILEKEILTKPISEYIGLTPSEIISKYGSDAIGDITTLLKEFQKQGKYNNYPPEELQDEIIYSTVIEKRFISREAFRELAKNNRIHLGDILSTVIQYPKSIANIIQKSNLELLYNKIESQKRQIVLDVVAGYTMGIKYPELKPTDYKKALEEQYQSYHISMITQIKDDLYEMYLNNNLPETVTKTIKTQISLLPIVTKRDVENANSYKIPIPKTEIKETEIKETEIDVITQEKPEPVIRDIVMQKLKLTGTPTNIQISKINDSSGQYTRLSPNSLCTELNTKLYLERRYFPTPIHFVYYRFFQQRYNLSPDQAYNAIQSSNIHPKFAESLSNFVSPSTLAERRQEIGQQYFIQRVVPLLHQGIDIKFDNPKARSVLLSTDDKELLWNDKEDNILGIGPRKSGSNLIGIKLMEKRSSLELVKENLNNSKYSRQEIPELIENSFEIDEWITRRISDVSRSISIVAKSYNVTKIDSIFVFQIITKLYSPCTPLYVTTEKDKTPRADIPREYIPLIKKLNPTIRPNGIEEIWKYIESMLAFVIATLKVPTIAHIYKVISYSEAYLSNLTSRCATVSQMDDDNNCMALAFVNLIPKLYVLKTDNSSLNSYITPTDIPIITLLILGNHNKFSKTSKFDSDDEDMSEESQTDDEMERSDDEDELIQELEEELEALLEDPDEQLEEEGEEKGEIDIDIFELARQAQSGTEQVVIEKSVPEANDCVLLQTIENLKNTEGQAIVENTKQVTNMIINEIDKINKTNINQRVKKNRIQFFANLK